MRYSWDGNRASLAFAFALLLTAAGCGESDNEPHVWGGMAARMGTVAGLVIDEETGAPIDGAEVEVGPQRARTRADGTFAVTVPAGQARVRVQSQEFLTAAREIVVAEETSTTPFKLARKALAQQVGSAGGTFHAREAEVVVPPGAYPDGSSLSLTYLSRVRTAATMTRAQFVDDSRVPRRAVAVVDLDASTDTPGQPVRARIPVPDDATVSTVLAYLVDENGEWSSPIMPDSVSGGFAVFALSRNGRLAVTIDARSADRGRVGYLVVDPGDGTLTTGDLVLGGQEISSSNKTVALVDPHGSRVELAAASRARMAPPAQDAPPDGGVATRRGSAPFAGEASLTAGRARVVVPRPKATDTAVRFTLTSRAASFDVRGTAFTVTTCLSAGKPIDMLEVVEGTVEASLAGKVTMVKAGETATFCRDCPAGRVPTCTGGGDGGFRDGARLDGRSADGGVTPSEAGAGDRAGDAIAPTDGGVGTDARPGDGGPTFMDATVLRPDASPPGPDTAPMPPTDAAGPFDGGSPPDTSPPPADAGSSAAFSLTPTSHSYGTVFMGTSATAHFMLTNTGGEVSGIPMVGLGGPNATEFGLTMNLCMTPLQPAASCLIEVTFVPGSPGDKSASLTASASPAAAATAALTAVSERPAMVSISPGSWDFGAHPVGGGASVFNFTVANSGAEPTGSPALTVAGDPDFTLNGQNCGTSIPAQSSCTVTVQFAPSTAGAKSGMLSVSANPGGSASAGVAGSGVSDTQDGGVPPPQDSGPNRTDDAAAAAR